MLPHNNHETLRSLDPRSYGTWLVPYSARKCLLAVLWIRILALVLVFASGFFFARIRILIKVMRICWISLHRSWLFTLMRTQIRLFTLMRIQIRPLTLMRIQIRHFSEFKSGFSIWRGSGFSLGRRSGSGTLPCWGVYAVAGRCGSVLPLGEQRGDGGHAHQETLPQEDQDRGSRAQGSLHRYLPNVLPVLRILIGFYADPDPAFYFSTDPGNQINADPDPGQTLPSQKVEVLHKKYTLCRS